MPTDPPDRPRQKTEPAGPHRVNPPPVMSKTGGETSPVGDTYPARILDPGLWAAEPTIEVKTVSRRIAGRYELGVLLGSGGFGSVYEARDPLSDRSVAVKLLGVRSEREMARFRYETTSLRLLQVPGVVRLLDDGVDAGEAYIVMERVAGSYFPGAHVPTSWSRIAQPTLGLLEALARVHSLGVIHRDLKPSNVLVDADGRVIVLDFGVSALKDLAPNDRGVVGTPSYLAPEQATGSATDARADLYTVGVMLFEALSGTLPHGRAPADAVMTAKVTRRAPPLRSVAPEVPADIAEIVDWLLESHPADRPASASDVIDAILGRDHDDPVRTRVEALAGEAPLTVPSLRPVFAGPDVFLHVPSDAAELAIERVGDAAESVANELGTWIRAGLARWEHNTVAIERAALHRITALPVRRRVLPGAAALEANERELLAWIALAGPQVGPATIAAAAELSADTFATLAASLEAAGVVRLDNRGGYSADASLVVGAWTALKVRTAHRALFGALRPGHPVRMNHAILASDPELIVGELSAFAEGAIREGRIESARSLLCEALRVLRRDPDMHLQEQALSTMAELAMTEGTSPAYDQLLYELGCTAHPSPAVERLMQLAQAGRSSEQNDAQRVLALTDEVGEFADPGMELRRRACRFRVARNLPNSRYRELLDDAQRWAAAAGSPGSTPAHIQAWHARLLYREGRFDEAGHAFLAAAASLDSAHARLRERLNAIGAFIETYEDLDALVTLAMQVGEEAAACRDPLSESRAFWIARAAMYRRGDAAVEQLDPVEASPAVGMQWLSGLIALQEGAFAWRRGSPSAADCFARGAERFADAGVEYTRVFCRLARILCDDTVTAQSETVLAALAVAGVPTLPPGIALQLSAMATRIDPAVRGRAAQIVNRASEIPPHIWARRRELLSVYECVEALSG